MRLRILNAEIERGYDIGFSDNRNFYIISNDGGLLEAPVMVNRVKLMVGERVEILVNLSGDAPGSTLDLKAYNAGQAFGFPGGEPNTNGQFGSLLNNINFTMLHINVGNATPAAITQMPSTLVNNTYPSVADVSMTRNLAITGGQGPVPFTFDNSPFVLNTINKQVNLNAIEKWTVTNNNIFGHSFHIHDVQFKIVERNGQASAVGIHEQGWKDVMYVPRNENVSFIARFDDFADAEHPFMYHCHFSNHEDAGMMGQFVVLDNSTGINRASEPAFEIYPNPCRDNLFIASKTESLNVYYVTIRSILGRTVLMLPKPNLQSGIDVSMVAPGIYTAEITDNLSKARTVIPFVKQ